MSIYLETKDLINTQQMEVAVNGPDGSTHLILCTGTANLGPVSHEIYTFLVGPQISFRQFVGVIVSGALSTIQADNKSFATEHADSQIEANLISIAANYDDDSGQVKVNAEVTSNPEMRKLAITYNVSILAELPSY
jgi:hypothetical protein